MKTVSDDLFRLIKSLSKSEKGYFKKYAAKNETGSKQNYILLFDAIDSMTEYDEELLKKKLKNAAFARQIPVYKVYLFNLILRSLSQVSIVSDAGAKIKEYLENTRILSSKALYKESLKQLKKAKELAVRYNNYILLLDALVAERNIITVMPDKNISEIRKQLYSRQIETLNSFRKNLEYSWLSDQMVICVEQKGDFSVEERMLEMENIIKTPLISNEKNAEDLNMMFYLLHTRLLYYIGKNNLQEVRTILGREIELMEANRHFIDDNPRNYSNALINYLLFSQITGFRNEVLVTITKLNRLRKKLKNKVPLSLQIQIFFHAANSEILVYRNSADLRRGRNLIKKINEELPKYGSEIPPQLRIALLSNIASFLFMDGQYEDALIMNSRILEEAGLTFKSDVYLFSKILNLIIHYELKNFDLLEYQVENTYKFFRDKNVMKKMESLIFTFLKKLVKSGPDEHKELFDELHFTLKKLELDDNTYNLLTMFDFIIWAESHASGIPMPQLIKNNSSKINK